MTEEVTEDLEERAAIMEFDGGMPRWAAERNALADAQRRGLVKGKRGLGGTG